MSAPLYIKYANSIVFSSAFYWRFSRGFIFTQSVEILALIFLIRFFFKWESRRFSIWQIIFVGFLASFATYPYLWFVAPWFLHAGQYIFAIELAIVFVEAVIYNRFLKLEFHHALLISFVCNSLSFFGGRLIFQ